MAGKRDESKRPPGGAIPRTPLAATKEEGGQAYARSEVRKWPAHDKDLDITFKSRGEEYPCHDDTLVVSIRMANAYIKRIIIDTRSSADILYFDTFQKLGLTDKDLITLTSTLTGFTGDFVSPVGATMMSVTFEGEPRPKTLMVSFMVVNLPSAYNAIIGYPTLNRLKAVVSTYHRLLKFSTRAGVGELRTMGKASVINGITGGRGRNDITVPVEDPTYVIVVPKLQVSYRIRNWD
ncbi:hypothetical protein BHE74_00011642 [Ensete ventricosum]|nr:hypothetical protein BHE74_00011642 [Ensete ventricosum]